MEMIKKIEKKYYVMCSLGVGVWGCEEAGGGVVVCTDMLKQPKRKRRISVHLFLW